MMLAGFNLAAQTVIPDDPDFKIGKLESGMTYYLYHSEKPKGCADFYIAHNVGAMQEEDNQNGLAHFLEHMAFNGTRHYPGKGLLHFLEKEGVRFGYNVNAYTSRYETVYNLSDVPLVRESFVDSVLLILHDWSCDISCEQQALDDERGVISEEWRLRDDPRSRMYFKQLGIIYEGLRAADRTVVGSLDVINGFKREEILDFYHTWYRPDLQAIIVVGDFDVAEMEARVQRMFSDIPAHPSPREKDTAQIPVPEGVKFSSMGDPTAKMVALKVMCLQPYPSNENHNTEEFLMDKYARQIVSNVLSARFKLKTADKGCPARSAVVVTSDYRPDYYLSLFTVSPRNEDRLEETVEFTQTEMERMARFGISREEFEVAKASVTKTQHLNTSVPAASVKNGDIVKMCVEHFLRNFPCVTPTAWHETQVRAMDRVDYDFVSSYPARMFKDSGKIYAFLCNESREDEMPSPETMQKVIDKVAASDLRPEFKNFVKLDFEVDPTPGRIVSDKPVKGSDARKWTLSNGATVYFTKCKPAPGDIRLSMEAQFDGGYYMYDQSRLTPSLYAMSLLKRYAGFRGLDKDMMRDCSELDGVSQLMGVHTWGKSYISMGANTGKVENAFKYFYLSLTEPAFPDEKKIDLEQDRSLDNLAKGKTDKVLFKERYEALRFDNHPWNTPLDSAAVMAVDAGLVKEVFERQFTNFSAMELYIASDLEESEIKAYVEKYVASLESDFAFKKAKVKNCVADSKGYKEIKEDHKAQSAPMCAIDYEFYTKFPMSIKNMVEVDILKYILSDRYLNLIREERGGTYHISFDSEYSETAEDRLYSEVSFQTRPEMRELLLGDLTDVMDRMCADGPAEKEMDAAVKYLVKRYGERMERISKNLMSQKDMLMATVQDGYNPVFDYKAVAETVKASDIKALARRINAGGRMLSVYTEE